MAKMKRCYTCGYREQILSRVVYCVSCNETMVHRYCIDPPRHGDEEFDWVCEVCYPRVYKQPKSRRTSAHSRLKLDSEAEKRKPRRRLRKLGHKSPVRQEDSKKPVGSLEEFAAELDSLPNLEDSDYQPSRDKEVSPSNDLGEVQCDLKAKESLRGTNKATQKGGTPGLEQVSRAFDRSRCSSQTSKGTHAGRGKLLKKDQDPTKLTPLQEPETDPQRNSNCSPRIENLSSCLPSVSRLHKRSSSFVHKDDNSHPTEEKKSGTGVNKGSAAHQPKLGAELDKLIQSFRPVSRVSWRRSCRIIHKTHGMSVELEAHLSNGANFKVSESARTLPSPLDLELVDKHSEWPKRFNKEPPCGNDIGLYFFASLASDRKAYDYLLGKMVVDDLILRFTSGDLRLLVLSSLELPNGMQRFDGKLYLWGLFYAPSSLPPSEKVSTRRPLMPSLSKEASCLEDLATNRRSCRPTGGEVVSVRKGQGSSDTTKPTDQNARANDQRGSGPPSSSPSNHVSETFQDSNAHRNPDTQIEGGRDSAWFKKRKHGKDDKEDFKQQSELNLGFFSVAKHKKKKKQKQWHSPCKMEKSPLGEAPKPGPRSQRHEPPTASSGAEHSVAMNGSFSKDQSAQSKNPHPHQVPSFTHHEMPVNKNWNQHSHPQPCPGFPVGQLALPVNWQSHPQPCPGLPDGQHPMPVTGHPHPMQYVGYPVGQHTVPPSYHGGVHTAPPPGGQHPLAVAEQSHPRQCAGFPGGQQTMPPGPPGSQQAHPQQYAGAPGGQPPMPPGCAGGQHALPVAGQPHPQQYAGAPGGQPPMPPGYPGGQQALPVAGQPPPQQYAGAPGGQPPMPPGCPGGQQALPVAGQPHPQQYAGAPGGQPPMPSGCPGGQHALPVAGQPHPQQYAGFSGGQQPMPHFQPYVGYPGVQHGMPMTGVWHPQQPYGSFPGGQQGMWQPHPQPHANFSGGQQAMPVVGSKGNCP